MTTAPRHPALTSSPDTDGIQVVFAPRSRESLWVLVALLLGAIGLAVGEGFAPPSGQTLPVVVVAAPSTTAR